MLCFLGEVWPNVKLASGALQVETIDPADMSAGSPAAVVTAKLGEKADLWGENGKQVDSYASTYRVEYKLVQRPNGSWRIADALVLG